MSEQKNDVVYTIRISQELKDEIDREVEKDPDMTQAIFSRKALREKLEREKEK